MLSSHVAITAADLARAQVLCTAAWVAGDPTAVATPGALAWWHAGSWPDELADHLRIWVEDGRDVAWTWLDGDELEWMVRTGSPIE